MSLVTKEALQIKRQFGPSKDAAGGPRNLSKATPLELFIAQFGGSPHNRAGSAKVFVDPPVPVRGDKHRRDPVGSK